MSPECSRHQVLSLAKMFALNKRKILCSHSVLQSAEWITSQWIYPQTRVSSFPGSLVWLGLTSREQLNFEKKNHLPRIVGKFRVKQLMKKKENALQAQNSPKLSFHAFNNFSFWNIYIWIKNVFKPDRYFSVPVTDRNCSYRPTHLSAMLLLYQTIKWRPLMFYSYMQLFKYWLIERCIDWNSFWFSQVALNKL